MPKVGILCASDSELEPFLSCMQQQTVRQKAMLDIHEGTLQGMDVAAAFSGVGKVNAAIAAQVLIDCCGVDFMINAGTCGGMDASLDVFDTVIATQVAYHDVSDEILTDFHPWMKSVYFACDSGLLAMAKRAICGKNLPFPVRFGTMVTGEEFIAADGRDEIQNRFAPLSVDMETAAVAHVCYVNQIPFIAIRTVTDTFQHSGTENFEKNCDKASGIARDVTLLLLNERKGSVLQ